MTGPGPWKRALALALLTTVIGPAIGMVHPASASAADPETPIFRITFPLVGPSSYHRGFGDCRDGCERSHAGVDIMTQGWKGVPVVAAHSGKVVHITRDSELSGVSIRIRARGGWETRYVHLNNDTPGTDDGFGNGLAPGLAVGDYVSEGQLIGWVGDSGNAEESSPHVHFEIRSGAERQSTRIRRCARRAASTSVASEGTMPRRSPRCRRRWHTPTALIWRS